MSEHDDGDQPKKLESDGDRSNSSGSGSASAQGVGYGRPPVEHQYKKGQSGNRTGRPRRDRNTATPQDVLQDIRMKALLRKVPIVEKGRRRWVTAYEAAALKAFQDGMDGKPHSLSRFLRLGDEAARRADIWPEAREEESDRQIFVYPENGRAGPYGKKANGGATDDGHARTEPGDGGKPGDEKDH
jgi:hypothetical protein